MTSSTTPADQALDAALIRRCCELAEQAAGHTAPNPLVGSVITQPSQKPTTSIEETIVGEGFHPKAGEPHAEIFALRAAGSQAAGGTLYVNLEPCNHTGLTPPCSDALIKAGIRRVVIGMRDPNPKASGGIKKLKAAGIEVSVGIEEARCRQLNEAFLHRIQHRQPFGILKYAMTLDGKIATTTGHSAWVSGPQSRQWVHQLRSRCDAVIVGGNTVRKDNPNLTSHGQGDHNPLRVVMSRQLAVPTSANLWQTNIAPTLVITQTSAEVTTVEALAQQGVEIVQLSQLTPQTANEVLYERGCMSVLWECGGTLAAEAIAANVIQKVCAFIAPKFIGGKSAPTPIGELGLEKMTDAKMLSALSVESIGNDILLQGYLEIKSGEKTQEKHSEERTQAI